MKIISPDTDSAFTKTPPDVPETGPFGSSVYSIDGHKIMNTVNPPAGVPAGPTGKVPLGLPFD